MTTLSGIRITSALDVRAAARRFYPNNISLQRKWIAAWRRSPGARVPISTRHAVAVDKKVAEAPSALAVSAIHYLRVRSMRT